MGGAMLLVRALLFIPERVAGIVGNVITALVKIWSNRVRSLLTVLGIIIAVRSIIPAFKAAIIHPIDALRHE